MKTLDALYCDYNTQGFCVAEGLLNAIWLEEIEANLGKFIQEIVPHLDKPHVNHTNGQINSIHCLCIKDGMVELPATAEQFITSDNFFWSLSQQPIIQKVVSKLLGDEPEFRRAELFAKPPHDGLSSPFHQDNFYWAIKDANALTVWMALNDCCEKNGALTYYPGSQKAGLIKHVDSNAPGSSQMVPAAELSTMAEPVSPYLRRGDALLHHSLTIHGSAPNKSTRARRGLTLQFKGTNSRYDMDSYHHYMKQLKEQTNEEWTNNAGI